VVGNSWLLLLLLLLLLLVVLLVCELLAVLCDVWVLRCTGCCVLACTSLRNTDCKSRAQRNV
jgi:hypothetical protein